MKERGLADSFNMIIQTEFIIKDNAQISYSTSWDDAMTIDVAVVYITGNTDVKHWTENHSFISIKNKLVGNHPCLYFCYTWVYIIVGYIITELAWYNFF